MRQIKVRNRNMILSLYSLLLIGAIGVYCTTAGAKHLPARLNTTKITLKEGAVKQLKVKHANKKIIWKSSRKKIATVSKKGLVKARKQGNAKIFAYMGKKKLVCSVKVTAKTTKKKNQTTVKKPSTEPTYVTTPNPTVQTASPVITAAPTNSPVATPTVSPDENWNTDKQSGTKEAYTKYFKVNLNDYTSGNGVPRGDITKIQYPSTVINETREAYVYTPNGYSTDKIYPVVYLIHGIGCDGSQWVSMQLNSILSNLIANEEIPPFVAVCPSVVPPSDKRTDVTLSPENIQAFTDFDAEFTNDLQPYIQNNYSVSKDRKDTAVCGLSMGGMEALSLGFSHLEFFDYIGSFSAAPTLDTSLLTTKNSEYIPSLVMLSSGTSDNTVGDNPKNYHEILTQNNVDHIWFQYPRGGHSPEVWQNGLINFLRRTFQNR